MQFQRIIPFFDSLVKSSLDRSKSSGIEGSVVSFRDDEGERGIKLLSRFMFTPVSRGLLSLRISPHMKRIEAGITSFCLERMACFAFPLIVAMGWTSCTIFIST
jgi:hypothetical protein